MRLNAGDRPNANGPAKLMENLAPAQMLGFFFPLSTRSMGFGESLDEVQHVAANATAADFVEGLRKCKIVFVREQFSCLWCFF